MRNLRIGSVPYLNAKPLVEYIPRVAPGVDISFHVPRVLADRLRRGELDAGLVPVVECFQHPLYDIVPGLCIASHGPVESVKLYCKKKPSELQRVALDDNSVTSCALAKILLKHKWGINPEYCSNGTELIPWPQGVDAILLIGDPALRENSFTGTALDLGEEWTNYTSLPFVYAVWAVAPGADAAKITKVLVEAKELGTRRLPEITRKYADEIGVSSSVCASYLSRTIKYDMDVREIEGARRFYYLWAQLTEHAGAELSFEYWKKNPPDTRSGSGHYSR